MPEEPASNQSAQLQQQLPSTPLKLSSPQASSTNTPLRSPSLLSEASGTLSESIPSPTPVPVPVPVPTEMMPSKSSNQIPTRSQTTTERSPAIQSAANIPTRSRPQSPVLSGTFRIPAIIFPSIKLTKFCFKKLAIEAANSPVKQRAATAPHQSVPEVNDNSSNEKHTKTGPGFFLTLECVLDSVIKTLAYNAKLNL